MDEDGRDLTATLTVWPKMFGVKFGWEATAKAVGSWDPATAVSLNFLLEAAEDALANA